MCEKNQQYEGKFQRILKLAPLVLIITYISTSALIVLTTKVASLFGYELKPQLAFEILDKLHGKKLVYFIGYGAILMPVVEEILFRVVLFNWAAWFILWLKAPGGTKISVYEARNSTRAIVWSVAVLSSIFFMSAHYFGPSPFPDNAFIGLVAFGVIQCWAYLKARSIFAPILNHVLFNSLNMFLYLCCGVK